MLAFNPVVFEILRLFYNKRVDYGLPWKRKTNATLLTVIIGKQFFPKILSASSEPGNTTRKACPSAS
ncbi:hypothetical protein NQ317_007392 [Molorchus minor]|uniref:Uncharacterized protein n=1 Tax=Molorchus minor TaxID=1323400 RepID=A0ABQ9JVD8_9CUCU|nr:hypothetical protein NQ317_007392 [Molorchus minor]